MTAQVDPVTPVVAGSDVVPKGNGDFGAVPKPVDPSKLGTVELPFPKPLATNTQPMPASTPAPQPILSMPAGDFRDKPFVVDSTVRGVDTEPRLPWQMSRVRADGASLDGESMVAAGKGEARPGTAARGASGARKNLVSGIPARHVPTSAVKGSRCSEGRFLGDAETAPQEVPVDAVDAAALCSPDPDVREVATAQRPLTPALPTGTHAVLPNTDLHPEHR